MNPLVNKIGRFGGKALLFVRRHKSDIMTYGGLGGAVVGTVLNCRATLKAEELLEEKRRKLETIRETRETMPDKYSEEDMKADQVTLARQTWKGLAKTYALPVGLEVASLASIACGHHSLKAENLAVTGAYMALGEAFKAYRKRVREDAGADKERELYYGEQKVTEEVVDENGEVHEETHRIIKPEYNLSQFSRLFDCGNRGWDKDPEKSLLFLRHTQVEFTNRLHSRGYVFLNEVYEWLGYKPTKLGNIIGWVDGHGDGFIDFGFEGSDDEMKLAFLNGNEAAIWLDFNVDGDITYILANDRQKGIKEEE